MTCKADVSFKRSFTTASVVCRELQEQVVSGSIPVDCSFVNASLVRFHLFELHHISHELSRKMYTCDITAIRTHLPQVLSQVPDLFLLQLAADKALEAQKHGGLKTRSLHAELVFNLSSTRQVCGNQIAPFAPVSLTCCKNAQWQSTAKSACSEGST